MRPDSKTCWTLVLIATLGAGGTGAVGQTLAPTLEEPLLDEQPPRLLAVIEDQPGRFVAWTAPQLPGDGPGLIIQSTMPDPPMVTGDFADSHSALEVYLALTEPYEPVPPALLAHATDADWRKLDDQEVRRALREKLASQIDEIRPAFEAAALEAKAGGCSAGDRAAMKAGFGFGYGPQKTCGDPRPSVFLTTSRTYNYCNGGGDCDYPLAQQDGASCSPQVASCDAIFGHLSARTARALDWHGNFNFYRAGHRYRFGVYNCSGNGPLRMIRSRGASSEITTNIPVNTYQIRVGGASHLPSVALAIDWASYGLWENGIPASGSSFQTNRLKVRDNSGGDDRAIICGDVQLQLTMSPLNAFCHNPPVDWCDDNSCTGACWD